MTYAAIPLPSAVTIVDPFGDGVRWEGHAPDGSISSDGRGSFRFTADDSGARWAIDQKQGRDCQHVELMRRIGALGATIDASWRVTPRLTNMVSRDQAYIIMGQIGHDLAPGMHAGGTPLSLNMHGTDAKGVNQIWVGTTTSADPTGANAKTVQFGPFPFALDVEHAVRIKAKFGPKGDGLLMAQIDGVWVVNEKRIALGYLDASGPVFTFGIYAGEHGIAKGSGRRIEADYRAVSVSAK